MNRYYIDFLKDWKTRNSRKPLLIRGARQIGKTYLVKDFGKSFENFIEINFEEKPEYRRLFITNDVEAMVENIGLAMGMKVVPGTTLLFLDEIQLCPEAITSLRYFYEKMPELHVIAAGSLLDHVLKEMTLPMPVGRIEFMYMYPLSFKEFLLAFEEDMVVDFLSSYNLQKQISPVIHEKLMKLLRLYFFIGGMPEAVKVYLETRDMIEVERVHESILTTMEMDFAKYVKNGNQDIFRKTLRHVPRSLGKKLKYTSVDPSAKIYQTKTAIEKLVLSRIIYKVTATSAAEIPLSQYVKENIFKPVFLDIGLATHLMKIRLLEPDRLILINEGELAEQFIGQQLLTREPYFIDHELYYWLREKTDSGAEVDYLLEWGSRVMPVEVKAGKSGKLRSLHVLMLEKKKDLALRFYGDLPNITEVETQVKMKTSVQQVNYQLVSLPLYLVNFIGETGLG